MAVFLFKNKNRIIFLGALAITFLMNFQRFLMVLVDRDGFVENLGLTIEALLFKTVIFFAYSYILLQANVILKEESLTKIPRVLSFLINSGLFTLAIITTTRLMVSYLDGTLERGQVFMVTLTNYLIVHPILLLLASFINVNIRQQQIILEREMAKQSALQHQLEALRSQINPHFLFNALNSLVVLIRSQSEKALPFVEQLSWLLRATLVRNDKDLISVKNELEYLESYIYLQKERFGDKFNVFIQIPESWKKEQIPSFSLQLLAENAIKHNVISTAHPLLLEIYSDKEYLIIKNKIHKRRDHTKGTALGLLNLSTRFKILKNSEIKIVNDNNFFTVKLPIIAHESHNH